MEYKKLMQLELPADRKLDYAGLDLLPKERQQELLKRIKRLFAKRYLSFRSGLRIALSYIPIGIKMQFQGSLKDAVILWQCLLNDGYMTGTLEEKLMHPKIGFTVDECRCIGLREDVAAGWLEFYETVGG